MNNEIVYEAQAGKFKALVYRQNLAGTWTHSLFLQRCRDAHQFWMKSGNFLPSEAPDAIKALTLASQWLQENTLPLLGE